MTTPTTASPEKTVTSVTVIEGKNCAAEMDSCDECQVYKIRWAMLILFVMYSMSNAFQWIQFSIINGTIAEFYGVSPSVVDMTSMIYMITYIPLIFPATFFLEKKGLRLAIIIGSFGTALGSWIKAFSASPSLFYVAFIGQTVVAVSQIFVLGIPALLAAVWFGPDQVSTATAIGVFGNQMGCALGFVLPPLLVKNGTQESIAKDLSVMFYGTGTITAVLFVLIVIFFRDRPPKPPSLSQAALLSAEPESYLDSMKRLLTNKGYLLLLLSYGMNVGVFYAISTVLSSFILLYFPDNEDDVGWIGLSIVVSGMCGSVVGGLVLDKTRRYKETTLVIYVLSFTGMIGYTFALRYGNSIHFLYLVFCALGFFMTGYLPVGFEFAAEITYPESEGTSSGLLNASAQIFGIIMTPLTRILFESEIGDVGANLTLAFVLALGCLMTALIKPDLRRTAAQRATAYNTTPASFDNGTPSPLDPKIIPNPATHSHKSQFY